MDLTSTQTTYHDYAHDLITRYLAVSDRFFGHPFKHPTLEFRKKGTVAGTAHLVENCIKINSLFLEHYQFPFLDEVIPHELAHLIAYQHFGRHIKPHGKEWQMIMSTLFHRLPQRTHHFTLPSTRTQQLFRYRCPCREHALRITRHRRAQEKGIVYLCTRCKQPLVFDPVSE